MKQKIITAKRILSFVMILAMMLPSLATLLSFTAFADDTGSEAVDSTPTVSLSWDTATVTVTDGVALPHRDAGVTDSSYTMTYKIEASGTVTNPITVRVQSFSLSAVSGQEYAAVDTSVTLTAEAPSATGTVTVYTQKGYATRVMETGSVYTREFGLRITEIRNAKRQSGGDTIRSQVLVANGYTLDVIQNKDGTNYGGGTGTFPNGYVYDGMQRDYEYHIGNMNKVPKNAGAWFMLTLKFSPMQLLNNSAPETLKNLKLLYGDDMLVYFAGRSFIDDNTDSNTKGYRYKIEYGDNEVVYNEDDDKWNWNNTESHWKVTATGDSLIKANHRGFQKTYFDYVKVVDDDAEYEMSFENLVTLDSYGNKEKSFRNYVVVMAANDTSVVAENFYIEDRAYGVGDTIYLTIRFNKPVQFVNNPERPLRIQAKIGSSSANYFTYCGGNMTDTLIFSMVLPEDRELNGNGIELVGFENEDYNKNLGDLFWNTSNKNNLWVYNDQNDATTDSLDDRLVRGQKLVCSVDTRTPSIAVRDVEGDDGTVKSASFRVVASKITNEGKIEVAWTKSEALPTSEDAWTAVTFFAGEDDKATVDLEKKGLTGVYYAHLRVTGVSGHQTFRTVGPFTFDNQSPTIQNFRLAVDDNASKYLKTHTVFFDISDVSVGVDEVYMKAHHTDGRQGLAGGVNEIRVYKNRSSDNALTIAEGIARISVSTDMLDLAENAYDAYIVEFYAIDALGNQSDVYRFTDPLMFDNRDTFETSVSTPVDISVKGKMIYYNGKTLTFTHPEEGGSELVIESLTYNGADITDRLAEFGISGTADPAQNAYHLALGGAVQGYVEIVFTLGDRWSNVLNFYVTGQTVNSPNYQSLYARDRLLINEVWQLSTATFYAGNNRNGSYYTGTNVKPIFSTKAKALDYARFYEKQDIVIEYIDDEVEKNNLEGGWLSHYRKADADRDKVVAVGQTWLRYKSSAWTLGSNNEEHWVYYFYSDEIETVIDPALTPALNTAIDRNAKLICNYDGDNRIYLTANNTSKGYVDSYGEPYYDPRGILTDGLSYQGIYSYEISIPADEDIYNSFISYNGQDVPLVANYTFAIDGAQHGFVYYRQYGAEEWLPILSGESIKDALRASGLYEICEFGNGYMTYLVYVDLDAPVISYELTVDGTVKSGYVTSDTSGGALRASMFKVKELVSAAYSGLSVERDRWSYFYVLYSNISGGEHAFLTMDDLNRTGYSLETGIYKIYACDRLGNMVVQTIKINTEDIEVTDEVSQAGLTIRSNRVPADIMSGTFKVWRDNMLLTDVTYAQEMTFSKSGLYRMEFEDVYGNVFSNTYSFDRGLPTVSFLREKREGSGTYEEIIVNSEDTNNLSGVVSVDDQLFVVHTSANIRISYPVSSGYDFEFVGDQPEYKTSILSTSNIDIKSGSGNWILKIFHKNDPDVYILITCIVDKEAPVISGTVQAKEYKFNEYNGIENVLFCGTGNTTSKTFYSGDRAVGDSVIISWSDDTGVSRVSYTYNGGEPVDVLRDLSSIELTDVGRYVFEVTDIYGNTSTFAYDFTDRIDFSLMTGDKEVEIKRDPETYMVGDGYTDTVYTGRETRLCFNEEALVALYYTDGSYTGIYNLRIKFEDGTPMLYLLAYDEELEEFAVIQNGEITLSASGTVFDGDPIVNYTYQNGALTLILPECQKAYELWQLRVSDSSEHCPVILQIERSDKVSQMDLIKEDGGKLDLSYEGYIGSSQILVLDEGSVSDGTTEIMAYYSEVYTDSFEDKEMILLYGMNATPFLEREGYYKIVATNKYGNERVCYVAISFKLSLDIHISYEEVNDRIQTLKDPGAYSVFSNKSVKVVIWEERASVTCLMDGNAKDIVIVRGNGYVEFILDEIGEYTVLVKDESDNEYTLSVSVQEPREVAYNGYLTGFNENALKKDQNYTNGALNLDKQRLQEGGICYVAFRKVGTNQFSVLYDVISMNPTEYDQANYNGIIGREDGEYEILFCDVYGNLHTEMVRISRTPMLSIDRQTQNSSAPSAYDLSFALQNGAWSNHILTFINTSEKYLLKVNGVEESFGEDGYTLMLPADLGVADQSYVLEYVDDYGNSYTINVYLHRAVPESWIADGADTVTSSGKMYARKDFSLIWQEKVTATYSLNGGAEMTFEMDHVFTEDGEYIITFTDYAGNTSTRTVIKDSTVLYHVSCDAQGMHSGAVVSNKVLLSPDEELSFTVTRNGEAYDNGSRSFTEDGYYVITLTDHIGNVQTFTFTLYAKAKQSFTFAVPVGYSFSQIWSMGEGHKVPLVSDVILNENGEQVYTFSADGVYEVELLHMESGEISCFSLTIDNLPPQALLVGAENGGVTRHNVSIEGLKSGDMIYVYKDGALLKAYVVDGDSETVLELLSNGDFGNYSVVIHDEAGNSVRYDFTKEFATNTYSNIFICLLLVSFGAIGVIFIRFNGKVRTK